MNDALATSLLLLFDNKTEDEIAGALHGALGGRAFEVTRKVQETHLDTYSAYWISPEEFIERIEDDQWGKFVGTRKDLIDAVRRAYDETPYGIYETMGYHLDDYIAEFRKKGLIVDAEPDAASC